MTFELATSLLNRASNGDELLQVLDSIASDAQEQEQPIQF